MKIHFLFIVTSLLTFTLFLLPCCDLYFPPSSFTGPFIEPTTTPSPGPVPTLFPTPTVPPDGNLIYNSDFSNGMDNWTSYINTDAGTDAAIEAVLEEAVITITNGSTESWHIQLIQKYLYIEQGKTYRLTFDARAESTRTVHVEIGEDGYDNNGDDNKYTSYGNSTENLTTTMLPYTFDVTMNELTDTAARLVFNLGTDNNDVFIDNVELKEIIP